MILLACLAFASIFCFRSSLIKIICFFYLFPIVILIVFAYGVPVIGVMGLNSQYYYSYSEFAVYIAFISYFSFLIPLIKIRKAQLSYERLPLSNGFRWLLLLCVVMFAVIAFPKAMFVGNERFNLLPGSGWSSFVSALSVLIVLSASDLHSRSRKDYPLFFLGLFLVFLSIRGERADILMGLILTIFLSAKYNKITEKKFSYKHFIVLLIGFFLMSYIGLTRDGGSVQLANIFASIYLQNTILDVLHVYMTSFLVVEEKGFFPITFLNLISSVLPGHPYSGVVSDSNFTQILRSVLDNVGGGLYYTAGYLGGGVVGVIFLSYAVGWIFQRTFQSKNYVGGLLFLMFVFLFLRFSLYGFTYVYRPLMLSLCIAGILIGTLKAYRVSKF